MSGAVRGHRSPLVPKVQSGWPSPLSPDRVVGGTRGAIGGSVRVVVVSKQPVAVLDVLRTKVPGCAPVSVPSVDDVEDDLRSDAVILLDLEDVDESVSAARRLRDRGVGHGVVLIGTASVDGVPGVVGLEPPFRLGELAAALQEARRRHRQLRVVLVSQQPDAVLEVLRTKLPGCVPVAVPSVDEVEEELRADSVILLDLGDAAGSVSAARRLRERGVGHGIVLIGTGAVGEVRGAVGLEPPFRLGDLAAALQRAALEAASVAGGDAEGPAEAPAEADSGATEDAEPAVDIRDDTEDQPASTDVEDVAEAAAEPSSEEVDDHAVDVAEEQDTDTSLALDDPDDSADEAAEQAATATGDASTDDVDSTQAAMHDADEVAATAPDDGAEAVDDDVNGDGGSGPDDVTPVDEQAPADSDPDVGEGVGEEAFEAARSADAQRAPEPAPEEADAALDPASESGPVGAEAVDPDLIEVDTGSMGTDTTEVATDAVGPDAGEQLDDAATEAGPFADDPANDDVTLDAETVPSDVAPVDESAAEDAAEREHPLEAPSPSTRPPPPRAAQPDAGVVVQRTPGSSPQPVRAPQRIVVPDVAREAAAAVDADLLAGRGSRAADDTTSVRSTLDRWRRRLGGQARAAETAGPTEGQLYERLLMIFEATSKIEAIADDLPIVTHRAGLYRALVSTVKDEFAADTVGLWRRATNGWVAAAHHGFTGREASLPVGFDQPVMEEVDRTAGALLLDPVVSFQAMISGIGGAHTESFMAASVSVGDNRLGIIAVGRDEPLVEADLDRLVEFAVEAAVGIGVAEHIERMYGLADRMGGAPATDTKPLAEARGDRLEEVAAAWRAAPTADDAATAQAVEDTVAAWAGRGTSGSDAGGDGGREDDPEEAGGMLIDLTDPALRRR